MRSGSLDKQMDPCVTIKESLLRCWTFHKWEQSWNFSTEFSIRHTRIWNKCSLNQSLFSYIIVYTWVVPLLKEFTFLFISDGGSKVHPVWNAIISFRKTGHTISIASYKFRIYSSENSSIYLREIIFEPQS